MCQLELLQISQKYLIPIKQEYKYLGIIIRGDGSVNLHIDKLAATKLRIISQRVSTINKFTTIRQRIILYQIYIQSHFFYLAGVMDT